MPVKGKATRRVAGGDRFGRLTVTEETAGHNSFVPVRCDCGTEKRVRLTNLVGGMTRSCGCLRLEQKVNISKTRWDRARSDPDSHPVIKHMIRAGDRFGLWTAVEDRRIGVPKLRFRCDCGTEREMFPQHIYEGRCRSCGCVRRRERTEHKAQVDRDLAESRRRETPINARTVLPGTRAGSLVVQHRSNLPGCVEVACERCGRRYETPLRHLTLLGVKACGCRTGGVSWETEYGWEGSYGMPTYYTGTPNLFPKDSLRLNRMGRLRRVTHLEQVGDGVWTVYTVPEEG